MSQPPHKRIVVGEIAGVYGVRGWVRIRSFTDPVANLLDYQPWVLGDGERKQQVTLVDGRVHGPGLIARIAGIEDREAAAALHGELISVDREQLPETRGEVYWADLEGLQVVTVDGVQLGRVDHLLETGANDVLVVRGERERLIPFVRDRVIRDIDLGNRCLTVDWDPEF